MNLVFMRALGIAGAFATMTALAHAQGSADAAQNAFGARSQAECPKETRHGAVDPLKVECFAEFAREPIPRAPQDFDSRDAAQVAKLEGHGYALAEQLNQPGVCSEDTVRPRNEACALIVYTIDPQFRETGVLLSEAAYAGPWTYVVVVYRITHPAALRDTTVWTVNSNYSEGWYGPGKSRELWRLTAKQSMAERCTERGGTRARASIVSAGVVNGSCKGEAARPTFAPQLIVPCGKPHGIFKSEEDMWRYCKAPTFVVEDKELAKIF